MTKITNFVWNPVDDCIMSELDGAGAVQAVYTNEPQQYGGVISLRRGTTTSTYHADALGSTRFLTDSSGNVTDTYLNDAWGNSVAATGTTVNPFKWVGKYGYYTDNSTAQVYVRARMYQPTTARWCSVDPLLYAEGINHYLVVYNSPPMQMDPSGYRPVCVQDCVARQTQVVDRQPKDGSTAGNVGITIETTALELGACGRFRWEIKFGFRDRSMVPKPSFILQHLKVTGFVTDCDGKPGNIKGLPMEIWEAWPYGYGNIPDRHNGLFAGGTDSYSSGGAGTCTIGSIRFFCGFVMMGLFGSSHDARPRVVSADPWFEESMVGIEGGTGCVAAAGRCVC